MPSNISKIDKGFVMCAGLGQRMRPLTDDIPKPMVKIQGKPLIDYILNSFSDFGVKKTVINTHYKADVLEDYLKDRIKPEIRISREENLLNTGGGIKKAIDNFEGEDFFIMNGDAYFETSNKISIFQAMQNFWNPVKMDILLLLEPVNRMTLTEGVGDYDIDEKGMATRSLNKKGQYMFTSLRINTSHIFDNSPDTPFNYRDLMDEAQEKGRLYGIVNPCVWHHISTPQDVENVDAYLEQKRQEF